MVGHQPACIRELVQLVLTSFHYEMKYKGGQTSCRPSRLTEIIQKNATIRGSKSSRVHSWIYEPGRTNRSRERVYLRPATAH